MASSTAAAAAAVYICLLCRSAAAGPIAKEVIYPNFTASNLDYIDSSGVFLQSNSLFFSVALRQPSIEAAGAFYLCVVHSPTNTVVWVANRNAKISSYGTVVLSPAALAVADANGTLVWSTPPLLSAVASLWVSDAGNLLLLSATNFTLWQSFDHPTATILSGQRLPAGGSLISPVSNSDPGEGDYRLKVGVDGAALLWRRSQEYWSIATDSRGTMENNAVAAYMTANETGIHIVAGDRKIVFDLPLPPAGFRIMTIDPTGRLRVLSFPSTGAGADVGEFVAPASDCDLPFFCGELGLCTPLGSNGSSCTCPPAFGDNPAGGCSPVAGLALFSSANCDKYTSTSYVSLGEGIGYVANKFANPAASSEEMSACRSRCDGDCTCLGFYYRNSTGSCFLFKNQLGSLISGDSLNGMGYVKASKLPPERSSGGGGGSETSLVAVLLPSIATILLILILSIAGISWWRKRRAMGKSGRGISKSKIAAAKEIHLGRQMSWESPASRVESDEDGGDEEEEVYIPGLPARFTYEELAEATDNFRQRIGAGGFGEVYRGTLPDGTEVAVKRIASGAGGSTQGRKEFFTEIAVIGSVRHVNLVRLRGFCARESRRMLVYEYMSRGSLDRSLFGEAAPALEWGERMEIAAGAARGLAYLHSGCDRKIVHCDVKPENILLHHGGAVKLSDFGLAKLLPPEQSDHFTTMRGTRGYLAPEWLTNSAISDKTDVYSFGMVLLEIVRGSKNRSDAPPPANTGGNYFPMVALRMHEQGRYCELADPRLEGRVSGAEVARAVKTALCCLHEEPALRPTMVAVVGMLEGSSPVWEPRAEALGFLRLYGQGFAAVSGDGDLVTAGGLNLSSQLTSRTASLSTSHVSSQQISGPR